MGNLNTKSLSKKKSARKEKKGDLVHDTKDASSDTSEGNTGTATVPVIVTKPVRSMPLADAVTITTAAVSVSLLAESESKETAEDVSLRPKKENARIPSHADHAAAGGVPILEPHAAVPPSSSSSVIENTGKRRSSSSTTTTAVATGPGTCITDEANSRQSAASAVSIANSDSPKEMKVASATGPKPRGRPKKDKAPLLAATDSPSNTNTADIHNENDHPVPAQQSTKAPVKRGRPKKDATVVSQPDIKTSEQQTAEASRTQQDSGPQQPAASNSAVKIMQPEHEYQANESISSVQSSHNATSDCPENSSLPVTHPIPAVKFDQSDHDKPKRGRPKKIASNNQSAEAIPSILPSSSTPPCLLLPSTHTTEVAGGQSLNLTDDSSISSSGGSGRSLTEAIGKLTLSETPPPYPKEFTATTVGSVPQYLSMSDTYVWARTEYTSVEWQCQLDTWLTRYPNITTKVPMLPKKPKRSAAGAAMAAATATTMVTSNTHELVTFRTKQTTSEKVILQQWDKLPKTNKHIKSKYQDKFRVDMWNNVVSNDASDGALCKFDVDHIFPWSRGGLSVNQNFAAVQCVANRTVKSDRMVQFLDPIKMNCGIRPEQFAALMAYAEELGSNRRDSAFNRDLAIRWLLSSPRKGSMLTNFQDCVQGSVDGSVLWAFFEQDELQQRGLLYSVTAAVNAIDDNVGGGGATNVDLLVPTVDASGPILIQRMLA